MAENLRIRRVPHCNSLVSSATIPGFPFFHEFYRHPLTFRPKSAKIEAVFRQKIGIGESRFGL